MTTVGTMPSAPTVGIRCEPSEPRDSIEPLEDAEAPRAALPACPDGTSSSREASCAEACREGRRDIRSAGSGEGCRELCLEGCLEGGREWCCSASAPPTAADIGERSLDDVADIFSTFSAEASDPCRENIALPALCADDTGDRGMKCAGRRMPSTMSSPRASGSRVLLIPGAVEQGNATSCGSSSSTSSMNSSKASCSNREIPAPAPSGEAGTDPIGVERDTSGEGRCSPEAAEDCLDNARSPALVGERGIKWERGIAGERGINIGTSPSATSASSSMDKVGLALELTGAAAGDRINASFGNNLGVN